MMYLEPVHPFKKMVRGKTPNGGDYSELILLDNEHNMVDERSAMYCVIRECRENGELIRETWGILRKL